MKKGLILIISALILIKIVNAQEITLFGQQYSLILVAPLFFMILVALIFLFIVVKDNISKIHFPKINLKSGKKHEKKEEVKAENFSERLGLLKSKSNNLQIKEYLNELSYVIKDFLKAKHNIKHEVTFEDLKQAKGVNESELKIIDRIITLKYSGVEFTRDEVNKISSIFENLIKFVPAKKEEIIRKEGFFSRLFRKKAIEKPKLALPKPELKIPIPALKIKEAKKEKHGIFYNFKKNRILNLSKEARLLIYKNPVKAKRNFGRALLKYNKLDIIHDKDAAYELNLFIREMLKKYPNEKHFLDVSKKIIELKHKGKSLSLDSLKSIRSFKEILINEERLVRIKLKEFSKKLELEKDKLRHVPKIPLKQNQKNINDYLSKLQGKIAKEVKSELIKDFKLNKISKEKDNIIKKLEGLPFPEDYSSEDLHEILNKKFTNEDILKRRNYILELLEKADSKLEKDQDEAKKYYGQALLNYYKLPVKKDDIAYSKIINFHNKFFKDNKELVNVSKNLIKLKHEGRHISHEGLGLLNKFSEFLRKEEHAFINKLKKAHEERLKIREIERKKLGLERKEFEKRRLEEQKANEILRQKEMYDNLARITPKHPAKLEFPKAPKLFIKDLSKVAPEPFRIKQELNLPKPETNYNELNEIAPEPLRISYDIKSNEKPRAQGYFPEKTNVDVIKVSEKEKQDLEEFNKYIRSIGRESYKYKQYITAGLPSYTRIRQNRTILQMPHVDIVKKEKINRRISELRREEQNIYDKLNKLS